MTSSSATSDGPAPNEAQKELIDTLDGIVKVDAGAGTGKTFALTRRYAAILDRPDVTPDDVLLVTFTRHAAEQMREKAIRQRAADPSRLRDAPIATFHGLCHRILDQHGFDAPGLLGLEGRWTSTTRVVENGHVERDIFRSFVDAFAARHPDHRERIQVLHDRTELLDLIHNLAAKGIYPTRDGWYQDAGQMLDGDRKAFEALFERRNRPRGDGSSQSALRSALSGWDLDRVLLPEAPDGETLRGPRGTKQIPDRFAAEAFEEDRAGLKAFVHDVYVEYAEHLLSQDRVNFGFLLMFAYALLCEDDDLRERLAFDHVMIDEFQDTNEVQFKIALLLAAEPNLCVVGDWKQAIYGFQHTSVENITRFEERLERYRDQLDRDRTRVPWSVPPIQTIDLDRNYRSTQALLDHSPGTLTIEATGDETVDAARIRERVVELTAETDRDHSRAEALRCQDEPLQVLAKIADMVGDPAYAVRDADADGPVVVDPGDEQAPTRLPRYGDIAVLTRTTRFAMDLEAAARRHGIPAVFEGGIDLLSTDAALILLAWLRILDDPWSDRGWAVVLEQAGYRLDETKAILDPGRDPEPPAAMQAFRDDLAEHRTVGAVARRVFERYGLDDEVTTRIVGLLQSTFAGTTEPWAEAARFIADHVDAEESYTVDPGQPGDAVTIRTIHGAKGLEWPIVVLADVNTHRFPSTGGGHPPVIRYADPIGLRQTKVADTVDGRRYRFDNWRARICLACLDRDYDEERRLLYVALTRARDHLIVTAEKGRESPFFEGVDLPVRPYAKEPTDPPAPRTEEAEPFAFDPPEETTPARVRATDLGRARHASGLGPAFGQRVHDFAEAYAEGRDVAPADDDQAHVRSFLDGRTGELRTEVACILPLDVDGRRVVLHGKADLIHVADDRVDVVDYKTDRDKEDRRAYEKQVSVYHHVVRRAYPDRPVRTVLFYTADGEEVEVDPLTEEELAGIVRDLLGEK